MSKNLNAKNVHIYYIYLYKSKFENLVINNIIIYNYNIN